VPLPASLGAPVRVRGRGCQCVQVRHGRPVERDRASVDRLSNEARVALDVWFAESCVVHGDLGERILAQCSGRHRGLREPELAVHIAFFDEITNDARHVRRQSREGFILTISRGGAAGCRWPD